MEVDNTQEQRIAEEIYGAHQKPDEYWYPNSAVRELQAKAYMAGTKKSCVLTKREHFAGLAMQGLLANQTLGLPSRDQRSLTVIIAEKSLLMADEILKQLSL